VSDPFLGITGCPDQQQILDGSADIEFLRYDDHAGTRSSFEKPREVSRHRLSIMRNQNTSGFRGDPEHIGIGNTHYTAVVGPEKIDRRFSPEKSAHDLVVEIRIRLEAGPHVLGV